MAAKYISRNAPVPPQIVAQAKGVHLVPQMSHAANTTARFVNPGVELLLQKREERISEKVKRRISELESLPADLAPNLLVKAMIELKQLKLLNFQRQMKEKVVATLHSSSILAAASLDPLGFRKPKLERKESLIQLFDKEHEKNAVGEQKRQSSVFMTKLMEHAQRFKDFHLNLAKIQRNINKKLERYLSDKVKMAQQKKEREYKERLKMLKEDNEEAYLNLLKESKNERINHLVEQTTAYLKQLTGLIIVEKKAIKAKDPNLKEEDGDMEMEEEGDASAPSNSSIKEYYYKLAHTQQEKVSKQPELISGGTLKPYQLVGLEWLVSLYNNNLNGILADEMFVFLDRYLFLFCTHSLPIYLSLGVSEKPFRRFHLWHI